MSRTSIIVLLAVLPFAATAFPQAAAPEVAQLVGSADEVLSGRIEAISAGQEGGVPRIHVSVAVEQTFKGHVFDAGKIVFSQAGPVDGSNPLVVGQFGMFFLRRSSGSSYVAADPFFPMTVAIPGVVEGAGAVPPLAAVTQKLVQVLAADPAQLLESAKASPAAIVGTDHDKVQAIYSRAFAALHSVPAAVAVPPLMSLSTSTSAPTRLWAVNALLDHGEESRLEAIKDDLMTPAPDTLGLVKGVSFTIESKVHSPESVDTLSALMASPVVEVRRGAASALRHIDAPSTLKPLSAALRDDDQMVRYYAVTGLARASHQFDRMPSIPAFKLHENEHLAYWNNWSQKQLAPR